MHRFLIIFFIFCLSSCSALRHVRSAEQVDSSVIDKSTVIVRDTVVETVNQVITQTVIEYYPVHDTVYLETPAVAVPVSSEVATSVPQPIKSITRTEIRTEAITSAAKDSVMLMDTDKKVSKECDTETKDSAPPAVTSIKWISIVLALIALCAIIILIKIRLKIF